MAAPVGELFRLELVSLLIVILKEKKCKTILCSLCCQSISVCKGKEFYGITSGNEKFLCHWYIKNMEKEVNMKEMVLYYAPENTVYAGLIKGVLVQMGIRIKNLTPGRCEKKIGHLAGLDGFADDTDISEVGQQASHIPMNEDLLVLCGLTEQRLDQLLEKLKKAGVPRSVMKAIVTESNAHWTVYELYGHLVEERRQMEQK